MKHFYLNSGYYRSSFYSVFGSSYIVFHRYCSIDLPDCDFCIRSRDLNLRFVIYEEHIDEDIR